MFKTKFKAVKDNREDYFVVIYKKWYQMGWHTLAVNGDPYKFANKDAAEYIVRCLEEAGT